jgi:hypothetical protein
MEVPTPNMLHCPLLKVRPRTAQRFFHSSRCSAGNVCTRSCRSSRVLLRCSFHRIRPSLQWCSPRALAWSSGITFIRPSFTRSLSLGRPVFLCYASSHTGRFFFRVGGGRPLHKFQFIVFCNLLEVPNVRFAVSSLMAFLLPSSSRALSKTSLCRLVRGSD